MANKGGRSTVYNAITSDEKLKLVDKRNIDLENDFIEYLESIDRSPGTIKQYRANLHVFWCWNLDNNNNKFFVDLTKRELTKFQNHCVNVWGWSPKRTRSVRSAISSLSNYIQNILDDEFEDFKPIMNKIEAPVNEFVRQKSIFTVEEIEDGLKKLIEKDKIECACAIALALYSGRRKVELTRFKVSYFDESNLICGGSLYKTPEKVKTKGRGSRGKMLDIYTLAKQFKPYFDLWMDKRKELGIESEWLFPKLDNYEEHIGESTMNSFARTFGDIIGKNFYNHALRHTYTTYLLEQNLPESVVQDIIGWLKIAFYMGNRVNTFTLIAGKS